nr:reverse transcriptase domain-containing protein [Tanacetum cinerariifolium]
MEEDGTEGPMIIEAEMGGHFVHRMKTRSKENPGNFVYSSRNAKIPSDWRSGHITKHHDYSARMHNGLKTRSTVAHNRSSHRRKDLGSDSPRISKTNYRNRLYFNKRRAEGADVYPLDKRKGAITPERNKAIYERSPLSRLAIKPSNGEKARRQLENVRRFQGFKQSMPQRWLPATGNRLEGRVPLWVPFQMFPGCIQRIPSNKLVKEDEEKTAFITSGSQLAISKVFEGRTKAKWEAGKPQQCGPNDGKDGKQMPIYFVSRALQGPEVNYTPMEKLILALMLSNSKVTGRLLKWRFELEEHDIHYRSRTSVKGHILADFIMERPEDDSPDTPIEDKEELPDSWILFTDGSSCIDGFGASLIITNPEEIEFTYALRFGFEATNNEAEYEALIVGVWIAEQIRVKNIQANVDLRLVANQVNETYVAKESGMIKYFKNVKNLTITFKEFSIKQVPRGENKKADVLSKMTSTSFAHLSKQVLVEELKEKSIDEREVLAGPGKVKFLIVAIDYFTKWIEAKPVATIMGAPVKKDNPFKDWCKKLCIRQFFASVKHPQANDLVERANRSLGEGIKARLDKRSKNWLEEISHVLWAHRTIIKSSNGEMPFSLTYGTKAMIPVEIGMPTLRTTEVDIIENDKALEINLDLVEERKEQAAIQEVKSKAKMEKYYNARFHNTSFKP